MPELSLQVSVGWSCLQGRREDSEVGGNMQHIHGTAGGSVQRNVEK